MTLQDIGRLRLERRGLLLGEQDVLPEGHAPVFATASFLTESQTQYRGTATLI